MSGWRILTILRWCSVVEAGIAVVVRVGLAVAAAIVVAVVVVLHHGRPVSCLLIDSRHRARRALAVFNARPGLCRLIALGG